MEEVDLEYHLENLRQADPDYVVDVLGLSSTVLVEVFRDRAIEYILEDFE